MLRGFKEFLVSGSVVELAVAVIIGVAFGNIIQALLDGLITPLIAAIFGQPDLTAVGRFEINEAVFSIGLALDAALDFLFIAAGIYFVIILPLNKLRERRGKAEEEAPEDTALLRDIRDLLASRSGTDR